MSTPAIRRALKRFERAVEDYAFLGTIPTDSEEALAARYYIEREYTHSRKLLEDTISRVIRRV